MQPTTNNHWTADPEAALILSTMGANPPRREQHERRYVRTKDEWHTYEGVEVERLRAIFNRWVGGYMDRGEHLPEHLTVEEAIDAILEAHRLAA